MKLAKRSIHVPTIIFPCEDIYKTTSEHVIRDIGSYDDHQLYNIKQVIKRMFNKKYKLQFINRRFGTTIDGREVSYITWCNNSSMIITMNIFQFNLMVTHGRE